MPEAFLGAFTDKDVTVTGIHSYYSGQMRELRHREGKYLSLGYTRFKPGMSGSKFCAVTCHDACPQITQEKFFCSFIL